MSGILSLLPAIGSVMGEPANGMRGGVSCGSLLILRTKQLEETVVLSLSLDIIMLKL